MQIIPPNSGLPPNLDLAEFRQPWDSPAGMPNSPRALPDPRGRASSPGNPGEIPVTAAHWYASLITLNFAVTTTSQRLLDQPITKRNFLAIRNSSASATVYVGFGTDASTTGSWLSLAAGTIILFDTVVPQDDLYFLGSAAGTVALGYSTIPG